MTSRPTANPAALLHDRLDRAVKGLLAGTYTISARGQPQPHLRAYEVASSERAYSVECDTREKRWSCDCVDFERLGKSLGHCKHTLACLLVRLRKQHSDSSDAQAFQAVALQVWQHLKAMHGGGSDTPDVRPTVPPPVTRARRGAIPVPVGPAAPSQAAGVAAPVAPPVAPEASSDHPRLASHLTQSVFLHVEDALAIGKLRLFAGSYRRGQGASQTVAHYLDVADARVVFRALVQGQAGYGYREFKGTPLQGGKAVSRVLSIQAREEKVFVELTSGPGSVTATGAITPRRGADPAIPSAKVVVVFEWHHAQRLAETVLAYLLAWEVCQQIGQASRQPLTSEGAPKRLRHG